MSGLVEIFEVGPRDGLQNEARAIPTPEKVALIDRLSRAGFRRIEVASFVSPRWVPQMADSADVLAGITRVPGVRYAALTPNMKGYEGARAARADEVAIFGSASEGFSKANINATIAESLETVHAGRWRRRDADGIPVRGYVSAVSVDCPYDGPVPPGNVAWVAEQLHGPWGVTRSRLGDTIGQSTPEADRRDAGGWSAM
jgi:hydroxymethylglutaryl-CoA lyase